jgi:integrase
MSSGLLGRPHIGLQLVLLRDQLRDTLAEFVLLALMVAPHRFEFLACLVHCLMRTVFSRAYMVLSGRAFGPQRGQVGPLLLTESLEAITFPPQVRRLCVELDDQRLAFVELELSLGPFGGALGDLRLRFGEGELPQLALLGQRGLRGEQGVLLFGQCCVCGSAGLHDGEPPHFRKRLCGLARQVRQQRMALQALRQRLPPLLEQLAHACRAAAAQFQAHAFHGGAFAARQHRVRGVENVRFRHPDRHALPSKLLGMIMISYPTLLARIWFFNTVYVMNHTLIPAKNIPAALDMATLDAASQAAAAAFMAAGTAANTVRSYRSALTYWSAWLQGRYAVVLGATSLPVTVVLQFVLDHLERPTDDGSWAHELPPVLDAALVAAGIKGHVGPLAYNTVSHRLAVLATWHRVHGWESPTDTSAVKTLLRQARKAQVRQGVTVRKKTAAVAEPLQALLATCTDGLRGVRDRALLLLAWSGGGRRRSEVVGLQVTDVRRLDADTWVYALGNTKTDTTGVRREKPLKGAAAQALASWVAAAPATSGPLFRRLHRGGRVGSTAMTADHVARMVQRRARLAGLDGDWAAHSLRSGFVTEAGRQGVPLGEVMAMTEHRGVSTVMGYFQAGSLLTSRAATLLPVFPEDTDATPL